MLACQPREPVWEVGLVPAVSALVEEELAWAALSDWQESLGSLSPWCLFFSPTGLLAGPTHWCPVPPEHGAWEHGRKNEGNQMSK